MSRKSLKNNIKFVNANEEIKKYASEIIDYDKLQKELKIDDDESYAANCVWINDHILLPKGFPKAKKTIEKAYHNIIEVNVSEFQKLDGGLSCLSLRF